MTKMQDAVGRAIVLLDRPVSTDVDASSTAAAHVAGSVRMSPLEQLDVYREQFWLRHTKSLRDDFPSVELLVCGVSEDAAAFERLLRAYLEAHPPAHFRLRDLSANMPAFLASAQPWADDPLLADCARLEWALLEAFDAPDATPLDPAVVATMREEDWPNAKLTLHPSMRFLELGFPVKDFREAVRAGEAPARPERSPSSYVAYRRDEKLFVEPVERAALALLRSLHAGEPLGPAGERAAAIDPKTEDKIGEWFQRWVTLGWISTIRVVTPERPA